MGALVDGWMRRFEARTRIAERRAELYRDAGDELAAALSRFAAQHKPSCGCRICGPLAKWCEVTQDVWLA